MSHELRVIFRTGGGAHSGMGHVRRCLALAGALRGLGSESLFLMDGDPVVLEEVAAAGFQAVRIRAEHDLADTIEQCRVHKAGAVVADSYAFDTLYFRGLAETNCLVVALDDLADRELPVSLVVNGTAGADRLRYRGAPHTRYLLGPRYIPLRCEFAEPPARAFAAGVRRVLITAGGSDPHELTPRLMRWTTRVLGSVNQDVVIGPLFGRADPVRAEARAAAGPIQLHENPQDLRRLMLAADLAVCGGGQTTYELAATGTPTVAIRLAENQTFNLKGLSEAGALVWAGDAGDADLESKVTRALAGLAGGPGRRAEMSRRGRALVDGQGALRVGRVIVELSGVMAS